MKIHKNKWNVEDSSLSVSVLFVGDVGRSTKPLMSLPEGSDGIEVGIYWHLYILWDSFISFFIYMLICLYVLYLYYSSLSTSISPMMHKALLTPPYGEQMATFSQKSVMGTIFETTERLEQLKLVMKPAIRNGSLSGLEYLELSGITPLPRSRPWSIETNGYFPYSSARDQLAHRTVAVKKLAEPFKTPAIARHMFREIKLLRQLRHENVSLPMASMK